MGFNLSYMQGGYSKPTRSNRSLITEIPDSLYRSVNRARERFMSPDGRHTGSFRTTITSLLQAAETAIREDRL